MQKSMEGGPKGFLHTLLLQYKEQFIGSSQVTVMPGSDALPPHRGHDPRSDNLCRIRNPTLHSSREITECSGATATGLGSHRCHGVPLLHRTRFAQCQPLPACRPGWDAEADFQTWGLAFLVLSVGQVPPDIETPSRPCVSLLNCYDLPLRYWRGDLHTLPVP